MADYAAIAAAIEQDRLRAEASQRAAQAVQAQQHQAAAAQQIASMNQANAAAQRAADMQMANTLAADGRYNEAAAIQARYVPSQAAVGQTYSSNSGLASQAANSYVPSQPAAPARRSTTRAPRAGGTGTTGTTAVTGSTGSTSKTVASAQQAPAQAVQPQVAYAPQVVNGGVQLARQPTPCELGMGGCESPTNVASNVATWQLDGNQPLSVHDARYLYPLLQQSSVAERSAAQAGGANLYDRALADPNLNANIQSLVSQGIPYPLALAQARKDATQSGYARTLFGMPQVIAAQDAAASVDQAGAAAAGAPYTDRYGQVTGYFPQVTRFDPTTGTYTVNNANYTGTGLGPDTPIAVNTIAGGLPQYAATARAGMASVANVANKTQASEAKNAAALNLEQAKSQMRSDAALQRVQAELAAAKELAKERARLKSGGTTVAPLVTVK